MFRKETEYALRGLVYIQVQNYKEHRPGIAEIAEEIDAPQFYTAKIFQRLVKQGFVKSIKGKGGGFFFTDDASDLTLKEIVKTIEGEKIFSGCGIGLKACDENNPCPIHDQFAPIRDSIDKLVTDETIQKLAKKMIDGKDNLISRLR